MHCLLVVSSTQILFSSLNCNSGSGWDPLWLYSTYICFSTQCRTRHRENFMKFFLNANELIPESSSKSCGSNCSNCRSTLAGSPSVIYCLCPPGPHAREFCKEQRNLTRRFTSPAHKAVILCLLPACTCHPKFTVSFFGASGRPPWVLWHHCQCTRGHMHMHSFMYPQRKWSPSKVKTVCLVTFHQPVTPTEGQHTKDTLYQLRPPGQQKLTLLWLAECPMLKWALKKCCLTELISKQATSGWDSQHHLPLPSALPRHMQAIIILTAAF